MFSHFATQLRNAFDVSGSIYNPDIINSLKKLEGQNIELEMKDNFISFHKTNEHSSSKKYPKIDIPKLKYCNKILTSKEYTPDLIGAKAVNLRKLEELKEQGKIDVIIPKSIALPFGYIENYLNSDNLTQDTEKLKQILQENGIKNPSIMVRSSFNGEDLSNYSAAGLYESVRVKNSDDSYLNDRIIRAIKKS